MDNKNISCFFTGHRIIPYDEVDNVYNSLYEEIEFLIKKKGVKYFYCGGALGFDTMCAQAILELKECYDIQLILVLPCRDQAAKWHKNDVALYKEILECCDRFYYVEEYYTKDCMLKRNREMVDNCRYGISYLTKNFGGTAYTVKYAKEQGCELINL